VKLTLAGLEQLCRENVVEVKFTRRHAKGTSTTRRMLATCDSQLLESTDGLKILNYRIPSAAPAYDARARGLLPVWDIFMQDYRNIPVNNTEVISVVSTRPLETFWEYFNNILSKMSASQKASFMGQ
jgi:hypothetical protein